MSPDAPPRSYRGYQPSPLVTDPESPVVKAWSDPALVTTELSLILKAPEPFKGLTTGGPLVGGLFELEPTGQSTAEIRARAEALLLLLDGPRRAAALRPIDSPDWMRWCNAAEMPHGLSLRDASHAQRQSVLELVRASLSARGFDQVWGAMLMNELLGEIVGNTSILNAWNYAITIFGPPSERDPWGWQLQGHHVAVNCFVLGDQIVATPQFVGAEPAIIDEGPLKGLSILQEEERAGFDLFHTLDAGQRDTAVTFSSMLPEDLPPDRYHLADQRTQAGAFNDNLVLPYEGLAGADMTAGQRDKLAALIEVYVTRLPHGHDRVRMREVTRHLSETHFSWIGASGPEDPFYYKVHSPVILIEFDHHSGVALDNAHPEKFHVHTQVRTPNGNDYGKDLLRQHKERFHWKAP
jgi:hypothetical protein